MITDETSASGPHVEDDPAARYSAWAGRMRSKRQAAKERITADQRQASGDPVEPGTPGYWSTDALFADSRRASEDELSRRPDPATVQELLAVLDLRDGADPDQLAAAYKRLAKQHHPDRFVGADPETQQAHAEQMLEINRAYRHLKTILAT